MNSLGSTNRGSGGCARKLGRPELNTLLAALTDERPGVVGAVSAEVSNRGDVSHLSFAEPKRAMLITTDLLYSVCDDGEMFGYIAAVHAMSDIYAALGAPTFGCVTLCAGRADVDSGHAQAIMRGLAAALKDHDGLLAGGHTVDAGEPFVNVTVGGFDLGYSASKPVRSGDVILLSKPLGSGVALAGRKLGVVTDDDLAPEYGRMRIGNDRAAAALRRVIDDQPDAVRGVTDVSGFGLLDALSMIARSVMIEIQGDSIEAYPHAVDLISEQAWSGLADSNLLHTLEFTTYDSNAERSHLPILLNDPQTSGGLLAILEPAAAASLLADKALGFAAIGKAESEAASLSVHVRSDARVNR